MKLSILVVVALAAVASVAAVGTWKQTSFSASVAMGVSFESDKMGYIAGGINGQGPAVWASTDAGKTWSQAETQQATMFMAVGTNVRLRNPKPAPTRCTITHSRAPNPAPPLLVAPRRSSSLSPRPQQGADAIVSGFLSVEHNDDTGRQFTKSGGWGAVGPCQSAEGIHGLDGGLAVTGETLLYNGVGVSTNGGKNFTISTIWGTNSTMVNIPSTQPHTHISSPRTIVLTTTPPHCALFTGCSLRRLPLCRHLVRQRRLLAREELPHGKPRHR